MRWKHNGEAAQPSEEAWELSNEFAGVIVRRVYGRNGVRLEIYSPQLNYRVQLDPMELESLTWQPPETFSKFLETPFGPLEDDD